jgi:hypothetical protein
VFIRAAILALAILGSVSSAMAQFPGSPSGGCPHGYDFNYSNGRCYPNEYKAPGTYARPQPDYQGYRAYGYGSCPDGYDFNYDNGRCYPNWRRAPGRYRY